MFGRRKRSNAANEEKNMLKTLLLTGIVTICAVFITGCQTVEGIGLAVQGLGKDISWMSKQRVIIYSVDETQQSEQLYYSQIGGKKALFRKVGDQYELVALK